MGEITNKALVQWSREYHERENRETNPHYMEDIYEDNQAYRLYERVVRRVNLVLDTNLPSTCRAFIRYFDNEDLNVINSDNDMVLSINVFTEEEINFFEFLLEVLTTDIEQVTEKKNKTKNQDLFCLLKENYWEKLPKEKREELYDLIERVFKNTEDKSIFLKALYRCQEKPIDLQQIKFKLEYPVEYRIMKRMGQITEFLDPLTKNYSKNDRENFLLYLDKRTNKTLEKMISFRDREVKIIRKLYICYFGYEQTKVEGEKYDKLCELWDTVVCIQKKKIVVINDIKDIEKLKKIRIQKVKKQKEVRNFLTAWKKQNKEKNRSLPKQRKEAEKFAGMIRGDAVFRKLMKERVETEKSLDQQIQMFMGMILEKHERK